MFLPESKTLTLGQLTEENMLQVQESQSQLDNRVYGVYPCRALDYLQSGKDTQRVREVDYDVRQMDRAMHFKYRPWGEVVPLAVEFESALKHEPKAQLRFSFQ